VKIMQKSRLTLTEAGLFVWLFFMRPGQNACAFDFRDAASISAAYTTHLLLNKVEHPVVAEEVGEK